MIKLKDVLKNEFVRLSNGNRWLILDSDTYFVYQRAHGKKTTNILYKGKNEDEAVRIFLE
jgi:hypothetical protein